jgi:hypothetical protein
VATGAFLKAKDLETFEQDRTMYGRRVQVLPQAGRLSPQPLEDTVRERVGNYLSERAHGFHCMGIEVYPGDGMSWSATSADCAIEETALRVPRLHLKGRPGSGAYPQIAEIISMRRIAVRAQKRGIATSARLLGTRRYVIIILAAIAVGGAGAVANAALAGSGFSSATLTWPFLGFAVASASLGIISQLLSQKLSQDSPTSPLVKIAEDIGAQASSTQPSDAYWAFIDDLAFQLGKFGEFRCLVVDDFTNLDNTTRHVLESYLRNVANDFRDELWVLFYSADDKRLEFLVNRPERINHKPVGFRHTHLFRMEHLSADQRRQLAVAYGEPQRAVFLTIRAIAQDDSGLASLGALFKRAYDDRATQAADHREGDSLDFFYIFALNAIWAGNPWMTTYDIRSSFSRQRRFRTQILQMLMPGSALSPTAISSYLDVMLASFFPLAGEISGQGRQHTFHVAPEAGEYLEKSWQQFGLANSGLVHLFWVLYWSDIELHGTPSVALLRKISHHLLKSTAPAEFAAQLQMGNTETTAFSDELFNTTLEVLRGCLKICLLADVPDLLNYALRLSEDDREAVEQRRRARLRPLAWQAYGLLGEERLLGVILDLDPAMEPAVSPEPPQSDLIDLFLRSMPRGDGDANWRMRKELTGRDMARHAGTYATTRASWLAASMSPFLGSSTPIFTAAVSDCRRELPAVVRACVDNLETVADHEWRTTDIMNVVLGLWSLALATDTSRAAPGLGWTHSADMDATFVDALVRACVLASDLSEQRRSSPPSLATLDLVLDCLAEELLAVVLAVAIIILRSWPDSAWTGRANQRDVVEVVRESARATGLSDQFLPSAEGVLDPRLIEDTARRMTLLAVLWRRLGFAQLASFMTIREAQFNALSYRRDATLAQSTMELLGSDLEQTDHIGLLAHAAAAEGTTFSFQLTSSLMARESQLSMNAGFSERISAELCMMAIGVGHSYDIDFSGCLDFLLKKWVKGDERRLETLLACVPPPETSSLVLKLLNAVINDHSPRADGVCTALERWIEQISDPEISKLADGTFRMFALRRHIQTKQPVDVNVEIDAWQDMRDLSTYAYQLSLLLPLAPAGTRDRVIAESLSILRTGEPYINSTGYVLLALNLFRQQRRSPGTPDEETVALSALRAGFDRWEQSLSADKNIEILRVLSRYDADHADDYEGKYLQWQQIILELDEAQRLPELIGQGRYFLLIWHYFEFFAHYGLRSEPPIDSFGLDEHEVAQALQDWRACQGSAPDPIVGGPDDERLSGEFLRIGLALFTPAQHHKGNGSISESELEEARQQFDEKARSVLETLYQLLGRLSQIPTSIEQILRRHETFVLRRMDDLERSPAG